MVSWCQSSRDTIPASKSSANDEVIFGEVALSNTVSPSLHLEERVKMSRRWQAEDRLKEGAKQLIIFEPFQSTRYA